ncbi:autotransporter domain-containing protein [Lysobacter maris]|uniref:Autotransporter domain-containing protein n=1 Tax=Marilutibacter maris TaxID=1605891 RepID=A0A508APR6_9GAMM|nr:autotransporter domain-containing protein [Lysobacter maris]KAB8180487.1 autotransporter domain-containing protein [Lysobacter maris]
MTQVRRSSPPVSTLALAIAMTLSAMPAIASEPTQQQATRDAVARAFAASDRREAREQHGAGTPTQGERWLRRGAPSGTEDTRAAPPLAAAATGAGTDDPQPYLMADGSRSADLEVAAASWRADSEFQGDWGLQAIGAEYAYARGITGAGVQLGIFDSGVDDRNPEFAGAGKLHLLDTRDGIEFPDDPYEGQVGNFDGRPLIGFSGYSDHGTHVGGTMVANRDGQGMHGVAFGASLHSATHHLARDAFTGIRGSQFDVEPAAFQALAQSGARFVNHSWGSSWTVGADASAEAVAAAIPEGWKAHYRKVLGLGGLVHVFASGNSGNAVHAGAQAALPAALPELEPYVVSVGSLDRDDALSGFSQSCGTARYWCVSAPGSGIYSATVDRSLPERFEAIRQELADGDPGLSRRQIIDEIIAYQDYFVFPSRGVPLPHGDEPVGVNQFHIDLLSGDAGTTPEQLGAFADRLLATAARISGLLHHLDIEAEHPVNHGLLYELRDDPFSWVDTAVSNLSGPGKLIRFPEIVESELGIVDDGGQLDRVVALQEALYERLAAAGYTPGHGFNSGTSMAAPHVTGALALVAERFAYLDNVQVRDTLLTTATDLGEAGVDGVFGWGKVDLGAAMNGPGAFLRDFDVSLPEGTVDTWSNDITNGLLHTGREQDRGALIKRGAGALTLSGDNSFDGFTVHGGLLSLTGLNAYGEGFEGVVENGALSLAGTLRGNDLRVNGGMAMVTTSGRLENGDLFVSGDDAQARAATVSFNGLQSGGSTRVGARGRLGGIGTLGDTTVAGTIAPGNSIGTLTVDGDYVQQAGSFFEVETTPPDLSDRLEVTGTATLEGGTVVALRGPGVYKLGQGYGFLSAAGGLSGRFAAVDSSEVTPFLKLTLDYAPTSVSLGVSRGLSFATFADTHNQRVTGAAIDGLDDDNAIVGSLVQLFPEDAGRAIDLLSGDAHASLQSVLVDGSRHLREAALKRGRGATDAFESQGDDDRRFGAWVEVQGNGGRIRSDGNAAGVDYNGGATLVGADYVFDSGLRVGLMGGIGDTDVTVRERLSARGGLRSRFAGAYLGHGWGRLGLRAGLSWGQHDVDLERRVVYAGFEDALRADYDADTLQGFVEAGYRFGNERWGIEPYAQFAQVRVDSDRFRETGGAAALSGRTRDVDADLTTAGVRFDASLRSNGQAQDWLSLRAGLGYRKTGGELVPWTDMSFADGGRFTVHGVPVASDATLLDLGVIARTGANSQFELGYSGQFNDDARDHGGSLRWSLRF